MLLHASCVSITGKGVLLVGSAGTGKSDLALRLIDGGAILVADDQVVLRRENDVLVAAVPKAIKGLIEIRHVGILRVPFVAEAPIAPYVELVGVEAPLERLPNDDPVFLLDRPVQRLRLIAGLDSTPAKIRATLAYARVDD